MAFLKKEKKNNPSAVAEAGNPFMIPSEAELASKPKKPSKKKKTKPENKKTKMPTMAMEEKPTELSAAPVLGGGTPLTGTSTGFMAAEDLMTESDFKPADEPAELAPKHKTPLKAPADGEEVKKEKSTPGKAGKYSEFAQGKALLIKQLTVAEKVVKSMGMVSMSEKLAALLKKVKRDSLKIQIVGNFKNGKSTFINAFLGESVLPAYALPCTAVINEVKYSTEKKALLYFKNPLPKVLPAELAPKALEHIGRYKEKSVPPMEIPYNSIEEYVVIPMGKDPKDMLLESPYERVELFYPLEILKNGVEIIDSPGLNEHSQRTLVTMDYLSKADAIVFVLNATMLCSMEEMKFIENILQAQGFKDLFFVVNRFDMIPEKERERIKNYAIKNLKGFTSFGEKGIFFVSAKQALDGATQGDENKLAQSAMPVFESFLSDFLTKERGKFKINTPSRELKIFLEQEVMEKVFPRHKELLQKSEKDIQKSCDNVKLRLELLEKKKEFIYQNTKSAIEQCRHEFADLAVQNMQYLTGCVKAWVQEYTPSSNPGAVTKKEKIDHISYELSFYVYDRIEKANAYWQRNTLLPCIRENFDRVFTPAKAQLSRLMEEAYITGDFFLRRKNTGMEGAYLNIYSMKEGTARAVEDMQVAGKSLHVLSFSSPFFLSSAKAEAALINKIKASALEEITGKLKNSVEDFSHSVTTNVINSYMETLGSIITPLDEEIAAINNQMNTALADISRGEAAVNKKKQMLESYEKTIRAICKDLGQLLSEE